MSALAGHNLNLHHGLLHAVRDVSLSLERGQVLALVGANGAGKTTLLRAIAGTHKPTSGTISLGDADITAIPAHRRVGMGVALVPEGRKLFGQMSVEENLMLGRGAGRPGNWSVERVLDIFPNLKPRRRARCATLSGGEHREAAMREVDEPHHREHEAEAGGDQRIIAAEQDALDDCIDHATALSRPRPK